MDNDKDMQRKKVLLQSGALARDLKCQCLGRATRRNSLHVEEKLCRRLGREDIEPSVFCCLSRVCALFVASRML